MHYVNKGRGHQYLACDNARRVRSCDAPSVPYFATFSYVMLHLDEFRRYEPDGTAIQERERELDALAGQIAETQEVIGRLVDSLERVQSATMEQRLADKETELSALKVLRNVLKEKAATTVDRSRPLDLDLDDDPVAEYILFEGDRPVPKDKIETVRALSNCEQSLAVPGLGFAEWGPGDLHMSFGIRRDPNKPMDPRLTEARERVKAACETNGLAFLDGCSPENITAKIDEGVRIVAGHREDTAEIGRAHTKRTMPV
ncbi:MAG: hypothetical protein IIA53_11215 [Chloroflexi bacterium]|nr:hypothetical protein [Chloroflexota bacterium]